MKKARWIFLPAVAVLFIGMLMITCAARSSQMDRTGDKIRDAKKSVSDELKVEPVDYEKLKKLLPKSLKKMKRTDLFGERTSALGVKISYARAKYHAKKRGSIQIKITDMGTIKKLASLAMSAWVSANIERKSDDGYERTFEYNGHRAYTKYSRSKEAGDLKVLVADRFLVEVEGKNVEMKAVAAALKKVNIKKLGKMRMVGVVK
jgi:hypothetical protein